MTDTPKQNLTATEADILGALLVIAIAITALALVIALVGQKDVTVKVQPLDGVRAHDLKMALMDCTPYQATFEQELACYQAIYGGRHD